MGYAIADEQNELAEAVSKFARRNGELRATRAQAEELASGERTDHWTAIVEFGLHALALPEEVGGQGASLEDLAVATEALAAELYPGPFVSTVLASFVVAQADESDARAALLTRFVEGATGAFVDLGELVEQATASGWSLTSTSAPVIGACAADYYVLRWIAGTETRIGVVPATRSGVTVERLLATDRTRDAGAVRLEGLAVDAEEVLTGLGAQSIDTINVALLSAEAAGVMRWASQSAVSYARIREQFGQPIGAFQSMKHRLARLFVTAELAAAASWGVATSLEQDAAQQRLAAGAAAIAALGVTADAVTEAITVFGGIGFTWEHDAHLYLRRAMSIAGAAGPALARGEQLGEAALETRRIAVIELPDEDPGFRQKVRGVLAEAALLHNEGDTDGGWAAASASGERRTFLADRGYATPHWPAPFGIGATPTEQIVIAQEFARAGLAQPNTVIGEWAVPTILGHGTLEQQKRFAPATARGDVVWCQLFSEPGAGSDLAGLSTRATKVDGGWQLQGQKVWTSGAHEADWGICLARTDVDVPKHRGLSYFLVDMRSPGIDVRPLTQATGEAHFNEVFLDAVFVPDDCLVGEPGQGWKITATTLANERTSISANMGTGAEEPLRKLIAAGAQMTSRAAALEALGSVAARSIAVGALSLRETLRRVSGLQPGAGSSVAKVATAVLARDAAIKLVDISGSGAIAQRVGADPALEVLALPSTLLGGGTVEIQLNIIAERVLMLPR